MINCSQTMCVLDIQHWLQSWIDYWVCYWLRHYKDLEHYLSDQVFGILADMDPHFLLSLKQPSETLLHLDH